MFNKFLKIVQPYLYPAAFLFAVISMAGSLYFSEVAHLAPCVLCWYQRIAMYPLVAILAVGMYFKDAKTYRYVLPLALIGLAIAAYHVVLYYGVNWGWHPEWEGPCRDGVSCTSRYIEWFGFITIPLLSFKSFFWIVLLMGLAWKADKKV